MKLPVLVLFWLSILFPTWRCALGFVPSPNHVVSLQYPPPTLLVVGNNRPTSSTTALYKSKTITCQIDGTAFKKVLTRAKSLERFFEEYSIKYLEEVDATPTGGPPQRCIGQQEFAKLQSGALYRIATYSEGRSASKGSYNGESLGRQGSNGDAVEPVTSSAPYTSHNLESLAPDSVTPATGNQQNQQAPAPSCGKSVDYIDADGRRHKLFLASDRSFGKFCEVKRIPCVFNKGGREIFDFDSLQDGATYTLGKQQVEETDLLSVKPTVSFDYSTLRRPEDVALPAIAKSNPRFICEPGWMDEAINMLMEEFEESDERRPVLRVRPIALISSSRSGKTRSMQEIAYRFKQVMADKRQDVAVIFITFNQHSLVEPVDENDPKQAFFRRLMFESLIERTSEGSRTIPYSKFIAMNYHFDEREILNWLGDSKVVLFVDELQNMKSATTGGTTEARAIGDFVRKNFLVNPGRFFVFSSHKLSTKNEFANILDSSEGSGRTAILQMLPMAPNMTEAKEELNPDLMGSREAIFDGLMPAMIYSRHIMDDAMFPKHVAAVENFNAWPDKKKTAAFTNILESLFTGALSKVPVPLHIMLATRTESGKDKIVWVPFVLQYLLQNLIFQDARLKKLAKAMANLLGDFKDAKEESGDSWEALFTFQLLGRLLSESADDFMVDKNWFEYDNTAVEFNSGKCLNMLINNIKNLEQLLDGIKLTDHPTIFVFFPKHNTFEKYDLIVLFWKDSKLIDFYGYQLKEGRDSPDKEHAAPTDAISEHCGNLNAIKSIWVRGNPPKSNLESHGWVVASDNAINTFFGESGRYWTPQNWLKLKNT